MRPAVSRVLGLVPRERVEEMVGRSFVSAARWRGVVVVGDGSAGGGGACIVNELGAGEVSG